MQTENSFGYIDDLSFSILRVNKKTQAISLVRKCRVHARSTRIMEQSRRDVEEYCNQPDTVTQRTSSGSGEMTQN
jgi:hypothetical protein